MWFALILPSVEYIYWNSIHFARVGCYFFSIMYQVYHLENKCSMRKWKHSWNSPSCFADWKWKFKSHTINTTHEPLPQKNEKSKSFPLSPTFSIRRWKVEFSFPQCPYFSFCQFFQKLNSKFFLEKNCKGQRNKFSNLILVCLLSIPSTAPARKNEIFSWNEECLYVVLLHSFRFWMCMKMV